MITLTTEQAQQIEEALQGVVNCPQEDAYWLFSIGESLSTIRAARAQELNLNCKSVQKRLATQWGYVKSEQAEQEPVSMFEWQNGNPVGLRKAAPVSIHSESETDSSSSSMRTAVRTKDLTDKDFVQSEVKSLRQQVAALKAVVDAWNNVEQEPVEWVGKGGFNECGEGKPLYAAPVRTKDLTDEEQLELARSSVGKSRHWLVAAVIAAYKEKNNANNNS